MPFSHLISFVFALAIFSQNAWATTDGRRCVVNPGGRNEVATSFNQSQEPSVTRFRQIMQLQVAGEAGNRGAGPYIKEACLLASLKRVAGSEGYTCSNGQDGGVSENNRARRVSGSRQCVTQDMVGHIQTSVQNAMKCVSTESGIPMDASTVYQKINNESAFQFYLSNRGGTGMGQLTSWPIRDMFQARPRLFSEVLNKIENSIDGSCDNFKSIIENDKRNPTLYPRNKICKYVSPGEGMNRNLLYSFVFVSYLKKRVLELLPRGFLAAGQPDLAERVRLVERLALVGYGPEGIAKAQGMARAIRANTNIQAAHQRVTRGSYYLRATDSKTRQTVQAAQPAGSITDAAGCVAEPAPLPHPGPPTIVPPPPLPDNGPPLPPAPPLVAPPTPGVSG